MQGRLCTADSLNSIIFLKQMDLHTNIFVVKGQEPKVSKVVLKVAFFKKKLSGS